MTALLGGLLALCACGRPGLDPLAAPVVSATGHGATAAPAETGPVTSVATGDEEAVVPDGRYAGLAILTAFHGDCNAGGTGELLVSGRTVSYRDARNPMLSGLLGPHGKVDLAAGSARLSGHFEGAVFTGRIAGGACEYQMRFERLPDQAPPRG